MVDALHSAQGGEGEEANHVQPLEVDEGIRAERERRRLTKNEEEEGTNLLKRQVDVTVGLWVRSQDALNEVGALDAVGVVDACKCT